MGERASARQPATWGDRRTDVSKSTFAVQAKPVGFQGKARDKGGGPHAREAGAQAVSQPSVGRTSNRHDLEQTRWHH